MRRQRFYPKCLSRIMAAIQNVDAQFLSQRKSPMRPFPGNKRINFLLRGFGDLRARAPGDDPDSPANLRASGNEQRFAFRRAVQSGRQFVTRNRCAGGESEELVVVEKERLQPLQSKRRAELGVVPEL